MPNWLFVILSEHPNLNAKGLLISVNFPYWAGGEPKCCPLSLLCSLFCCLRRVGGTRLVPTGLGLPYKLFIFAYACQQPRAYHSFYSALVLSLANVRHKGKRVASALRRSSSWQKSCGDMLNKRVRDSSETTNTPTTSVDSFRASHSDTPNLCVWIRSFNSPVAQALQQNLVPETSYISHVKGKTVHAGSRTSTFNNSVSLWLVHFVSCTTLSILPIWFGETRCLLKSLSLSRCRSKRSTSMTPRCIENGGRSQWNFPLPLQGESRNIWRLYQTLVASCWKIWGTSWIVNEC